MSDDMPDSAASNPETAGPGGAGAADVAATSDAAVSDATAVSDTAVSDTMRRLRAAMKDAVAGEHPPANLLGQVRARRRRHRARAALVSAAAVVIGVLVFPPAAAQLRDASPPGGPAAARPPAPLPRAVPGTVLKPCDQQIGEQLPLDWRRESVQAGPVWFVGMKQATATYYHKHKLAIGGLLVQVRAGVTASVKVVGPASGHFRFLFGPGDFIKGVDSRYTLKDGENGVTFADCPANGEASFVSGYTQFGGYFLIDKIPQRVTLEVQAVGGGRPVRVTLLVGY